MDVTMMNVAEGRKGIPWISHMDEVFPPGTPVWYCEDLRHYGFPLRYMVSVASHPDKPTLDHMARRGFHVPHGAVVPMKRH